MKTLSIFTDVSVDSQSKTGIGTFLILSDCEIKAGDLTCFKDKAQYKIFKSTSSTKLEIETLLWCLVEIKEKYSSGNLYDKLLIYTDSQCIAALLDRREKLEKSDYKSISKGKMLNNAELYKKFYDFYDMFNFEIIKLKGHSRASSKDNLHKIFAIVDKGSRKSLRKYIKGF